MWNPGDMLIIPVYDDKAGIDDDFVAIVVAVKDTGWGTLGQKWDALILHRERIVTVRDAWRKRWRIVEKS